MDHSPNDFPELENNWANTYATTYQVPTENKLQRKTYDIGSSSTNGSLQINWKEEGLVQSSFTPTPYVSHHHKKDYEILCNHCLMITKNNLPPRTVSPVPSSLPHRQEEMSVENVSSRPCSIRIKRRQIIDNQTTLPPRQNVV
ncbi:hypothetical protein Tco_0877821 [Tanacetum coccineum]|uniref:Uncharacterized protein n=1 Tax=Tanacetum coccineum TaxID=301880 RepID=A0ABQ5BW91_9ASTR